MPGLISDEDIPNHHKSKSSITMDFSTEVSISIKTTHLTSPSPCGTLIASINDTILEVHQTSNLELIRSIPINSAKLSRLLSIDWSPIHASQPSSTRLLLASEDSVRVWDLEDRQWSATIDNGSGGLGKIAHAEFGADDTEVLIFSSFGASVAIWSLQTGKKVEIKDPKFPRGGHGRNKESRNGTFALLTRPTTKDVITLHAPGSYEAFKSISLPTVDAEGIKWSKGGQWLAVWDTPTFGYKVYIYSADGNLYRRYAGDCWDESLTGLGLRSIEWSPSGGYCAMGGYDGIVTLVSTKTFSPAVYLAHPSTLKPKFVNPSTQTWQETISITTGRTYSPLILPTTLPKAISPETTTSTVFRTSTTSSTTSQASPVRNHGITQLSFNATGHLLAIHDSNLPTTVWIWDLRRMQPIAILLQHSVIRKLLWHPTDEGVLMITCVQDEAVVYLWKANGIEGEAPRIIDAGSTTLSASNGGMSKKFDARWMTPTASAQKAVILATTANSFVLVYPDGQQEEPQSAEEHKDSLALDTNSDPVRQHTTSDYTLDHGDSQTKDDSSLLDLTSTSAPDTDSKEAVSSTTEIIQGSGDTTDTETAAGGVDDTFHHRKVIGEY